MNRVVVGAVIVLAGTVVVPAVVTANEPPLADAGLDRAVDVGVEVRLDATGSRDPDGSIGAYEWEIDTPNGTVREPACGSCARTWFVPTRIGQYNATVTVTDDDGATRSDTLYVTVEPGRGPAVSLSGPIRPAVGTATTYVAGVAGRGVPLDSVQWTTDGSTAASGPLGADDATDRRNLTFDSGDARQVTVTVTDVAGQQATDSLAVDPRTVAAPGVAGGGGGGGCSTNIRTRSSVTRMDCGTEEVSGESTQVLRVGSGDDARFVRIVTETTRIEGVSVQPVAGPPEGEDTVVERETQIQVFEDRSSALPEENTDRTTSQSVTISGGDRIGNDPLLTHENRQVSIGEENVLQELGMGEFEANLREDGDEISSEENLPEEFQSGDGSADDSDGDSSSSYDSDDSRGDSGGSSNSDRSSDGSDDTDPVGSSGPGGRIAPGDVGDFDPDGSGGSDESTDDTPSTPVGSPGPGGHIGPGMGVGI